MEFRTSIEASVTQKVDSNVGDPLAALFERRSELEAEHRRVSAPEQSRQTAMTALSAAEADLVELDRSERGDWAAWADAPEGPQPEPRHAERRCIEQRAALARADLRGAEAAVAAVQSRLASINGEMNQLAAEIYRRRLETVLAELPELEQSIIEARNLHVAAMVRLRGIAGALNEEVVALRGRGELGLAGEVQAASARLEAMKAPEGGEITWGAVTAEAARVREALQ
jgi:hypothetical protein